MAKLRSSANTNVEGNVRNAANSNIAQLIVEINGGKP
jgi:hypothetical protein